MHKVFHFPDASVPLLGYALVLCFHHIMLIMLALWMVEECVTIRGEDSTDDVTDSGGQRHMDRLGYNALGNILKCSSYPDFNCVRL